MLLIDKHKTSYCTDINNISPAQLKSRVTQIQIWSTTKEKSMIQKSVMQVVLGLLQKSNLTTDYFYYSFKSNLNACLTALFFKLLSSYHSSLKIVLGLDFSLQIRNKLIVFDLHQIKSKIVSLPQTQQQTKSWRDLNCQPLGHWTTHPTDWAAVVITCMLHLQFATLLFVCLWYGLFV